MMVSFIIKNLRTKEQQYYVDGKEISYAEYKKYSNQSSPRSWRRLESMPTTINKFVTSKVVYNEFRKDIQRWEQKIQLFKYFHYYRYKIWKQGKTEIFYRLWRYKSKTAKIIYCTPLPPITVDCEEFRTKYKGNKYLVPVNYVLECDEA